MLLLQVIADGAIVFRRFDKGSDGKTFAQSQRGPAIVVAHVFQHHVVIGRVDNDCNRFVILCGAADHRRPTDVDVFDRFRECYVRLGNRCLKWIKIDYDKVDRLESTFARLSLVFRVAALVKKSAVHARMQSFHTPFQHFGKCSETRDLTHGHAFFAQQFGRPAGRDDVDPLTLNCARE